LHIASGWGRRRRGGLALHAAGLSAAQPLGLGVECNGGYAERQRNGKKGECFSHEVSW
jgi:hypothetical protein